jgi:hypothetical protein
VNAEGWNIYTLEGPKGWYAQVTASDGRFGESNPNLDTEASAVAQARKNAIERKAPRVTSTRRVSGASLGGVDD